MTRWPLPKDAYSTYCTESGVYGGGKVSDLVESRSYPGQGAKLIRVTKQLSGKRARSAGGVGSNVRFEITMVDVTLIVTMHALVRQSNSVQIVLYGVTSLSECNCSWALDCLFGAEVVQDNEV
jgi:hypothetical protein